MDLVLFFKTPSDLRKWLEKNYNKKTEQWIGFYKKSSGKESIDWSQSVDQALCFGWIDGIRKSIDDQSYKIRFTPRKPKSIWSAINIKKVEELTKNGKMYPAGLEAFAKMDEKKSKLYSFERSSVILNPKYEKLFKKNKKAWMFFNSSTPSYKKTVIHWVMSAKQEETRVKRLKILINDSEAGEKIAPLRRLSKAK
jgi:uncharacterized protein YdeI (YjbR/CyaY-like superfamily)